MENNSNTKVHSILSYITWVGLIVVFFIRDKEDEVVKFHLNQALVLDLAVVVIAIITGIGGIFYTIGRILSVVIWALRIVGIVRASKLNTEPIPYIGTIQLIK